jgi:Fe-S-cluster-containing hydrogenase component 2
LPESKPRSEECRFTCAWQCGICIAVCRHNAISHGSDMFRIDRSVCSECKLCVGTCPAGIIGEDLFA